MAVLWFNSNVSYRVKSPSQLTHLHIAVAASVVLHAALLAVRFAVPDAFHLKPADPGLEVILVNAKHAREPIKAEALAQANLDGGGNAEKGRSKSPLPNLRREETGDAIMAAEKRITELTEAQNNLVSQNKKTLFRTAPVVKDDKPDPNRTGADVMETSKAMARKEAEIYNQIDDQNKRPKKTFISPSTKAVGYAQYYSEMKKRIEEIGTLNFPQKNGRKLYGELIVHIPVYQDGSIFMEDGGARIEQSSGKPDLDQAALTIVRRSAPFGRFPAKMRSVGKDDVWVITTHFSFTRLEKLETELR
jgi:protein TonB